MAKKQMNHSRICFACGEVRTRTQLGYDMETMKTYCLDVERCGVHHDTENLVPLTHYEEFMKHVEEYFPEPVTRAFEKMIGKTVSFRANPALLNHILRVSQSRGCGSLNQTITTILEEHMKQNPLDDMKLKYCDWELDRPHTFERKEKPKPEPEPVEAPKQEHIVEEPKSEPEPKPKPVVVRVEEPRPVEPIIEEKPVQKEVEPPQSVVEPKEDNDEEWEI